VIDALPTREDAAIIFDRINKVIPVAQAIEYGTETVTKIAKVTEIDQPVVSAAKFLLREGVMSSSLSAEQKSAVLSLIEQNTANSVASGVLPNVQIHEKHVHAEADRTPSSASPQH
jgi:hypothetical protein